MLITESELATKREAAFNAANVLDEESLQQTSEIGELPRNGFPHRNGTGDSTPKKQNSQEANESEAKSRDKSELTADSERNGKGTNQEQLSRNGKQPTVELTEEDLTHLKDVLGEEMPEDPKTIDQKQIPHLKNIAKHQKSLREKEKTLETERTKVNGQSEAARKVEEHYKNQIAEKDMELLKAQQQSQLTPDQWRSWAAQKMQEGKHQEANQAILEASRVENAHREYQQRLQSKENATKQAWDMEASRIRVEMPDLNDKNSDLFKKTQEALDTPDPNLANLFNNTSQGPRYAAQFAKMQLDAAATSDLREKFVGLEKENTELKRQLKERDRKLSPSSGVASQPPAGGDKDFNSMNLKERGQALREYYRAKDRGEAE